MNNTTNTCPYDKELFNNRNKRIKEKKILYCYQYIRSVGQSYCSDINYFLGTG